MMPWRIIRKDEVNACKPGDKLTCNNAITSFSGEVKEVIPDEGAWIQNTYGRYFANPNYFQIKKWEEV